MIYTHAKTSWVTAGFGEGTYSTCNWCNSFPVYYGHFGLGDFWERLGEHQALECLNSPVLRS